MKPCQIQKQEKTWFKSEQNDEQRNITDHVHTTSAEDEIRLVLTIGIVKRLRLPSKRKIIQ